MATLTNPDQTLARLRAAAAARRVTVESYLDDVAANAAEQNGSSLPGVSSQIKTGESAKEAMESIRQLANDIRNKANIHELIENKHLGHKH